MADSGVQKYSEYDHHDPGITLENVHDSWDTLRSQCPIGRSDAYGGMWVVTGFPEANEIFHKPEIFSSSPLIIPPFPQALRMVPVEIDPPDHNRYRTLVAAPFSPRRAERYEEPLRVIVNQLIDEFIESGSCDVYQTLAIPFPTLMGTTMLGLPNADALKFEEWTHKIIHMSATDMEVAGEAVIELYTYFYALLEERRANPVDDVMSLLAEAEVDGVKLTEEELMGFCLLLLIASIDTSQKAIGSMLWQLATEPELRQRIAADPSQNATVVEEFLRYWAPVQPARRAVVDTEVGGVQFKAGDQLLVLLGAANLDDREFPNACQFQPDRTPNRHLTFGTSIHRCLGSHIARIELRVLLDELLRRIPDFELQPGAEAEWSKGQVQGVVKVPIQFAPGKRESAERLETAQTP
jgi:cytochrome P450